MQVFINYRVEDTGGYAWAVYLRLEQRYGAENVFLDKTALRPGMRWLDEINRRTSGANVFLALIGSNWVNSIVQHMQAGTADFVVKEVSRALRSRLRVEVIPVLVRADPPDPRRLPLALKPVCDLQWARLEHESLEADLGRLIVRLDEIAAPAAGAPSPRDPPEPAIASGP